MRIVRECVFRYTILRCTFEGTWGCAGREAGLPEPQHLHIICAPDPRIANLYRRWTEIDEVSYEKRVEN